MMLSHHITTLSHKSEDSEMNLLHREDLKCNKKNENVIILKHTNTARRIVML